MNDTSTPGSGGAASTRLRSTDLRGVSRLTVEATLGLTGLVEHLHHNISRAPGPLGQVSDQPTSGITGLVYRSIRGVTRLVGGSLDAVLGQVEAALGPDTTPTSPEREAVLAALNGVLGDHLAATGNPLAIPMRLHHAGQVLEIEREAMTRAVAQARPRVLLMVHGLCMNHLQWCRNGHDHGAALAVEGGFTPLYLHYNTGLHVSTNGRLLAEQLQALLEAWPVPLTELVIVGHSMGGLVARSALQQAKQRGDRWPSLLTRLAFLGTPHHGAPMERGGQWIDKLLGGSPYTAAFARLGKLRSAGITDLRHGSLLDADWQGSDRFAHGHDTRVPVPLPEGVACYAIAAALGSEAGELHTRLLGDGLVPVDSALGRHKQKARCLRFEPDRVWIGQGMNHFDLLDRAEVLAQLRRWLIAAADTRAVETGDRRAATGVTRPD